MPAGRLLQAGRRQPRHNLCHCFGRLWILKREFTSVIEKRGKWYVAYVEEIPGVNTEGRTLAEARRNLKEALTLIIEANRRKGSVTRCQAGTDHSECLSARQ